MSVPWPEGSVRNPPTSQQMLTYLDLLGTWIDHTRTDLDRLDQKLQEVGQLQGVQDLAMTLTVWQAIKDRYTDLTKVWDSGRVIDQDLKKLAVMIWSNLNDQLTPGTTLATGGGLSLTLPEACRMLEALVAQLSSRYQLASVPTEVSARIASLRAQIERIRDQAELDPPQIRQITEPQVTDLASDVKDLIDKADRGGDIGGILGPLEVRAAHLERDLIVGHSERAMLAGKISQARSRQAALVAREQAVDELVKRTQAAVDPAPKYAVPHVQALGEIPTTAKELDAYLARLDQVSSALDIVQNANQKAYATLTTLLSRLEKAEAMNQSGKDAVADTLSAQIRELLDRTPAPIGVITPLIAALEASGRSS